MSILVPGDPASVSALAAELARCAALLEERRSALRLVVEQLDRWRGPAAESFRTAVHAQASALAESAEAMTTCCAALQRFVVDVQHARAMASDAERHCREHGLELGPDGRVAMPWGAYPVEAAQAFLDALPEAQRRCERARDEGEDAARRLARQLDEPTHRLRAVAAAARGAR